jgi:hypothetical protein
MTDAAERFLKSLAEALTNESHVFEYPYPDDREVTK